MKQIVAGLDEAVDGDVDALLDESDRRPVLLYFTVEWCVPCEHFGPTLAEYGARRADVALRRVDCEQSTDLAGRYGVDVYPTLVLIRSGQEHWRRSGALDADELTTVLDPLLSAASSLDGSLTAANPVTPDFEVIDQVSLPVLGPGVRAELMRGTDTPEPTKLASGTTIRLEPFDSLRLIIEADERVHVGIDHDVISAMPRAPYSYVVAHARRFSARDLRALCALEYVDTLMISALEPLDPASIDVLSESSVHHINVQAPGFEAESLRRRMPGTLVNYSSISEKLAAQLTSPRATATGVDWTSPAELAALIDSGEAVIAMVQSEHPADDTVARVWHDNTMSLPGRALSVSAYGSELVEDLALGVGRPAIAVFRDGALSARADLPDNADELCALAARLIDPPAPRRLRPATRLPAREIALVPGETTARLELIAPGAPMSGAVTELADDSRDEIPSGWRVRARARIDDIDALPWRTWAAAGLQELQLVGDPNRLPLNRLSELRDLEHLEIWATAPAGSDVLAPLVTALPSVRSLRTVGADVPAPAVPSDLIVNGTWND